MGGGAGPFVGDGFAAIVEGGPDEGAGEPGAGGEEFPPVFGGCAPLGGALVVGADVAAGGIVFVDSAGADGAGFFGADDDSVGMLFVIFVDVADFDVVPAVDVDDVGEADAQALIVHGGGDFAGGVELVAEADHGFADALAGDFPLDGVFFVGEGPEEDAGVIAIAADHRFKLGEHFGGTAGETVFGQDENAETVAGVEKLGGVGIVRGAEGVASEFY